MGPLTLHEPEHGHRVRVALLGEYLSNLRAALDHAVNGVAGASAGDYTKFPIVAQKDKFRDAAKGDLEGVPPLDVGHLSSGCSRTTAIVEVADCCCSPTSAISTSTECSTPPRSWFTRLPGPSVRVFRAARRGSVTVVLGDKAEVRITFEGAHSTPKVEGGAPYQISFGYPGRSPAATRVDLGLLLAEVRGMVAEIGDEPRAG